MGTNYYTAKKFCEHCGRYEEDLHIGKSSYGWTFSFRGYPDKDITSWRIWKRILATETIVDEYGKVVPMEKFVKEVEERTHPKGLLNHVLEMRKERGGVSNDEWLDPEGHGFSSREFS